jgi:hypothetical protein
VDAPQWAPEEHLGHLLVVQVQDVKRGVETEYGARDCIVADVHVIDPAGSVAMTYEEAWLFGTVLFSQLGKKKGRTVLGVFEQGEKRPGKKAPWRLADPTDAQEELALRAMTSRPDRADEQPAQEPQQPAREPQPAAAGKAPWE